MGLHRMTGTVCIITNVSYQVSAVKDIFLAEAHCTVIEIRDLLLRFSIGCDRQERSLSLPTAGIGSGHRPS